MTQRSHTPETLLLSTECLSLNSQLISLLVLWCLYSLQYFSLAPPYEPNYPIQLGWWSGKKSNCASKGCRLQFLYERDYTGSEMNWIWAPISWANIYRAGSRTSCPSWGCTSGDKGHCTFSPQGTARFGTTSGEWAVAISKCWHFRPTIARFLGAVFM